MNSLPIVLSVLGLITSSLTIATFLWKAMNAIANLKTANASMGWRIEALELTVNGVRERAEHLATRLQGNVEKLDQGVEDIQGYLQKNTTYERRGNR